jgi:hypothetical protein
MVADGLSNQIQAALAGNANPTQAHVVCKTVDSLIKLARLQIELGAIDWASSAEAPVLDMELSVAVKKITQNSTQVKPTALNQSVPKAEKLNHTAKTSQGQDIERQIHELQKRIAAAPDKEAAILTDHLELQRNKLKRLEPDWKG